MLQRVEKIWNEQMKIKAEFRDTIPAQNQYNTLRDIAKLFGMCCYFGLTSVPNSLEWAIRQQKKKSHNKGGVPPFEPSEPYSCSTLFARPKIWINTEPKKKTKANEN